MGTIFTVLALLPTASLWWIWRIQKPTTSQWFRIHIPCIVALVSIAAASSWPFLTSRGEGTGEAYNYSLGLADAVIQLRAGEFPPLVGQTEYAFNGRIHPLRNAPYLFYLGGALDAVTFHQLTTWELQNLSVALSLWASVFVGYFALRRATCCSRPIALLLCATLSLSPAILTVTYSLNMLMTVHAAPFLIAALAATVRQARRIELENDVVMGFSLGAAWLAHPPIALWLTGAVVVLRAGILISESSARNMSGAIIATLLCGGVGAFVYASASSAYPTGTPFSGGPAERANFIAAVIKTAKEALPQWLVPIHGERPDPVASLQLGYAHWLLLLLGVLGGIRAARERRSNNRKIEPVLALLGLVVVGLLVFTLPVPGITETAWQLLPDSVLGITNIWPAQRTLPVLTTIVILIAGLGLEAAIPRRPWSAVVPLAVLGWVLAQAYPLLSYGMQSRWSNEASEQAHLSSNLNLTVTSYSFLGLPPSFVHGVMDPYLELRLLRDRVVPVKSNYEAALAISVPVAQRELQTMTRADGSTYGKSEKLHLDYGKRYLLTFDFSIAPVRGTIHLKGRGLSREYLLPESGKPEGFGMLPGNRHAIGVWTAMQNGEDIEVEMVVDSPLQRNQLRESLGRMSLREYDVERLPIKVQSFLPLRLTVDSPESGCYIETFRQFSPGYRATVNERSIVPLRSENNSIVLPVPKGLSRVKLWPDAPLYVHLAIASTTVFAVSSSLWIFCRLFALTDLLQLAAITRYKSYVTAVFQRPETKIVFAAGGALTIVVLLYIPRWRYSETVGPLRIQFNIPAGQAGRPQALMSTGEPGRGVVVFATCPDEDHLKISFDVWGTLYESDVTPITREQTQDLVVSFSALYPPDSPRVQSLPGFVRKDLRNTINAELNGKTLLRINRVTFDSRESQLRIGGSRIGGSSAATEFAGRIERAARLPIYPPVILNDSSLIRIQFDPTQIPLETRQPLFSIGGNADGGVGYFWRDLTGAVYVAFTGENGTKAAPKRLMGKPPYTLRCAVVSQPGSAAPAVEFFANEDAVPEVAPPTQPILLQVGINPGNRYRVDARFLGRELDIRAVESSLFRSAPQNAGPIELLFTLPSHPTAQSEPLLVTGKTGAADLVFVHYVDSNRVVLGIDHWARGIVSTEPIEIDYSRPHRLVVSLTCLYPPRDDQRWGQLPNEQKDQLLAQASLTLDGRLVLQTPLAAYPIGPDQVAIGENRIGGSSCEPEFSGSIFSSRRLGLSGR